MIGAVVGDYFGGSTESLGVQIESAVALSRYELGWAAILVASMIGMAFYVAVALAERFVVRWHPSAGRSTSGHGCDGIGTRHNQGGSMKKVGSSGRRSPSPWRRWRSSVWPTAGSSSHKATKVTLQLKWVTQAQFAGYYAAQAKGYYKQVGLDVTLKPGGPDIIPEQVVLGGQARVRHRLAPSRFSTPRSGQGPRQHRSGLHHSGMTELTYKKSGINSIAQMKGKKYGVWIFGNEFEQEAALVKAGSIRRKT